MEWSNCPTVSSSVAANFVCLRLYSRQPWSAYAVHLTTLSPPALLGDLLLIWLCHKATTPWGNALHDQAMTALYMWMFTSKWIKLLGHYIRYPVDVFLLPVSILFGYFHGIIKMYAVMTLNVVSCMILSKISFLREFRVSLSNSTHLLSHFLSVEKWE